MSDATGFWYDHVLCEAPLRYICQICSNGKSGPDCLGNIGIYIKDVRVFPSKTMSILFFVYSIILFILKFSCFVGHLNNDGNSISLKLITLHGNINTCSNMVQSNDSSITKCSNVEYLYFLPFHRLL